jgi:hypothetical protein
MHTLSENNAVYCFCFEQLLRVVSAASQCSAALLTLTHRAVHVPLSLSLSTPFCFQRMNPVSCFRSCVRALQFESVMATSSERDAYFSNVGLSTVVSYVSIQHPYLAVVSLSLLPAERFPLRAYNTCYSMEDLPDLSV